MPYMQLKVTYRFIFQSSNLILDPELEQERKTKRAAALDVQTHSLLEKELL